MNVKVYEVGPRDGLQSLPHIVPVEHRQELIKRLRIAGLSDIEEVSFVNPRVLPQMSDAEAVFSGQGAALVLNKRGFERAKAAGVEKYNIVLSPCEFFSLNNMGRRYDEMVMMYRTFMSEIDPKNVRVYLSMAFGSPESGAFSEKKLRICVRDAKMFGETVVFADTVGAGTPFEVNMMAQLAHDNNMRGAFHFHHRGEESKPLMLVRTALLAGIREFDSSVGGLGGCPFAKGSGANLSTGTLVRHLHAWDFKTGVDTGLLRAAEDLAFTIKNPQPPLAEAHC